MDPLLLLEVKQEVTEEQGLCSLATTQPFAFADMDRGLFYRKFTSFNNTPLKRTIALGTLQMSLYCGQLLAF